jgi:anti-sigma factor RsiW
MACDIWRNKIDAYTDAELSEGEMRALGEHLPACASCTADLLCRVQLKRAIHAAGKRYSPSEELRQRVQKRLPTANKRGWLWNRAPKFLAAAALVAIVFVLFRGWSAAQEEQIFGELADLHVATLASATPVDVVSTDRHTVKPWFQGKLPFTFNIPELANTPFMLEGGRMSYLGQSPGAQLIFRDGNHRISVFIFQDRLAPQFALGVNRSTRLTFHLETWTAVGLRYFVIGDADPKDVHRLSELLKIAAQT